MTHLTDLEIQKAFRRWHYIYEFKHLEGELSPFLNASLRAFAPSNESWLKKSRKSLYMSTGTVAQKLGVSRSVYSRYEEWEAKGAISLATLAKAAAAMDCELVYAIRPKQKVLFSHLIWNKLFAVAIKHPWLKKCDQRKRAEALGGIMRRAAADPKFRRSQEWTKRLRAEI